MCALSIGSDVCALLIGIDVWIVHSLTGAATRGAIVRALPTGGYVMTLLIAAS